MYNSTKFVLSLSDKVVFHFLILFIAEFGNVLIVGTTNLAGYATFLGPSHDLGLIPIKLWQKCYTGDPDPVRIRNVVKPHRPYKYKKISQIVQTELYCSFKIVNMKISYYFLALFTFSIVEAKVFAAKQGNRIGMFNKYHERTIDSPRSKQAKKQISTLARRNKAVVSKLCTTQTCCKCLMVFSHPGTNARRQAHCFKILTLRNCCPRKLLLRLGF